MKGRHYSRDFRRVLRYAKRVGVKVVLAQPSNDVWACQAPFHDAAIGRFGSFGDLKRELTMIVYWYMQGAPKIDWACALLHEIGHVLLGVNPMDLEEGETLSGLVAHDYHVARYLRISGWQNWMSGYEVDIGYKGHSWNAVPGLYRHQELKKSRAAAVKNGLLTKDLLPIFRSVG